MTGKKQYHKLYIKHFCLLKPVSDALQNLVSDLECQSSTEVVRRSLILYDDYSTHLGNKEKLVSIGNNNQELVVPKYELGNWHKRFNIAFNEFYVGILNRHRDLYESTYHKTVSDSVMLVKLITKEIYKGKSIGYGDLNSSKEVGYDLFLPVKHKAEERLRKKKGKIKIA